MIHPSLDLTTAYFFLALIGTLLAVYWAATLARDPAMLHVPAGVVHMRRACILAIAISMLWSLVFAYEQTWEPWPPYLGVVAAIDAYLVASITSAVIRRRVCMACPLIDEKVRTTRFT